MKRVLGSISIILMGALCGCEHLPTLDNASFATKCKPPTQMVVTVNPTALEEDGLPAHQGMLCRVYFFAGSDPAPVEIDGDVVITAHDEEAGNPSEPEGLYRISADEVDRHLRKDIVGSAYAFWLPYEPLEPRVLIVNVNYQSRAGKRLVSKPMKVKVDPLPRRTREGQITQRTNKAPTAPPKQVQVVEDVAQLPSSNHATK